MESFYVPECKVLVCMLGRGPCVQYSYEKCAQIWKCVTINKSIIWFFVDKQNNKHGNWKWGRKLQCHLTERLPPLGSIPSLCASVALGDGALRYGWGFLMCLLLSSYVSNQMFGLYHLEMDEIGYQAQRVTLTVYSAFPYVFFYLLHSYKVGGKLLFSFNRWGDRYSERVNWLAQGHNQ